MVKTKSAAAKRTRRIQENLATDMIVQGKPVEAISEATGLSMIEVRLIMDKTL
jgi:hypothetical protein